MECSGTAADWAHHHRVTHTRSDGTVLMTADSRAVYDSPGEMHEQTQQQYVTVVWAFSPWLEVFCGKSDNIMRHLNYSHIYFNFPHPPSLPSPLLYVCVMFMRTAIEPTLNLVRRSGCCLWSVWEQRLGPSGNRALRFLSILEGFSLSVLALGAVLVGTGVLTTAALEECTFKAGIRSVSYCMKSYVQHI